MWSCPIGLTSTTRIRTRARVRADGSAAPFRHLRLNSGPRALYISGATTQAVNDDARGSGTRTEMADGRRPAPDPSAHEPRRPPRGRRREPPRHRRKPLPRCGQVGERVSLATVYNTLRAFCDAGLMQEVTVDGTKSYFDTRMDDHPHFYWEDTATLTDAPGRPARTRAPAAGPRGDRDLPRRRGHPPPPHLTIS